MNNTFRFGFYPINSQFVKNEEINKIAGGYFNYLEAIGGEQWNSSDINKKNPIIYLMITGGTEEQLLNILKQRNQHNSNEPAIILAFPTHNSLPAALEALARLHQDNKKGQIIFLNGVNDKTGIRQLEEILKDLELYFSLKNTRIGLVGSPSDWLVASSPKPTILQNKWGPEVVDVSMSEIKRNLKSITINSIKTIIESLVNNAVEIREPSNSDLQENVKVYIALKKTLKQHKLDAITVRCFDLILEKKITGCFALAQLLDDKVIAGCEGDLVSTMGMIWCQKLLGVIPWMANPAGLNIENNTLWLAHCTVPRSIVKKYSLRSHFESGLGVGIQGTIANGPVTLLRIGGKQMEKIWLAEGNIIQTGKREDLCRTQVEIKLSTGNVLDLLQKPLGNHIILVQGHHQKLLFSWWKNMIE